MQITDIRSVLKEQQQFFLSGATSSIFFRVAQLKKLKLLLQTHEGDIVAALKKDLFKSRMESVVTEILLITEEIDYIIKHLSKWARTKKVASPFPLLWPGRSYVHYEPYGSALIIGPWNYPCMLTLSPLAGAISAGNCAVIKPSEVAIATQTIIIQLIEHYFPKHYIAAVAANPEETQQLLQEKFDYIFFTGGTETGKLVMAAAAKQLTPLTLELGGKSPCIVDETANLDFAARRIIWAKMTNAGQTCIAPDYLYIHRSCKETFISKLQQAIIQFYGNRPEQSSSYGRIINQKHFDRLINLMQKNKIIMGGQANEAERYIAPTLLDNISWHDPIMQEEIFGPLLPILTYDHLDEIIATLKSKPKPLSLYLFTKNKQHEKQILQSLSFGSGCVNDCMLQVANYHAPFGGIGSSGIGNYHGQYSFETFSHKKNIYQKTFPIDFNLEYPPYSDRKLWWLRQLLKL